MATNYPQVVIGTTANANAVQVYANDAAFVSGKGSAAAAGDWYYNSTDGTLHWYDAVDAAWRTSVSTADTQTLTNKTLTDAVATLSTPTLNGLKTGFVTKDSATVTAYNVAVTDYAVWGNTDTAAQVFTLPVATSNAGLEFEFRYTGTGFANSITIDLNNGTDLTTLNTPGEMVWVRCDGSTYHVVGRRFGTLTEWTAVTMAIDLTGGTFTGSASFWRRVNDTAEFWLDFVFATVFTGGAATISLPHSLNMDTAKIPGTEVAGITPWLGTVRHHDVGSDTYAGDVFYQSASSVIARVQVEDSGVSTNHIACANSISTTIPFTWANNDRMHIRFSVPISGWKG